jgi:hypothetical protein
MATVNTSPLKDLLDRVRRLARPDPTPLLQKIELIIKTDNYRGILARQDKDGNNLPDATYRPKIDKGRKKAPGPSHTQRNGAGKVMGVYSGRGPAAAGLNNNLTSAEYRKLGGPGTAPRGPNSRVITNLYTQHTWDRATGECLVGAAWRQVVSTTGYEFLEDLFEGRGRFGPIAKRDLRGIRPWGRAEIDAAIDDWGTETIDSVIYL